MEYDYIVVGAGSAGCVVAARLSEDPDVRVLLLEAGPRDRKQAIHIPAAFSTLFKTELDWDYETVPQQRLDGRSIYWPRGKMLGGSSSMNAMMWVPGFPADYDEWGQQAGPGWNFASVRPYLRRAEHAAAPGLGRDGPMWVSELREPNPLTAAYIAAANSIANVDGEYVVRQTLVTQRRGRRCSTADAYLRPARRRRNLVVHTNAHAYRLVTDGGHVRDVEYSFGGARTSARAGREVILCGGAVNSPQLLMVSGIGPADELRRLGIQVVADSPEVGANLQDHLVAALIVRTSEPVSLFAAQSPKQLAKFLLRGRGMLTSNVAEAYGFIKTQSTFEQPDVELIFAPVPFVAEGLAAPTCHGFSVGAVLLKPRSRGRVALTNADPTAAPTIDPAYLTDPEDRDRAALEHGLRVCADILATSPLREFAGELLQPTADEGDPIQAAIRRYAHTLYHPVATCRMGSDTRAPVDEELHVRGVSGLRVVDASVIPAIVRGHTNAPTIAVAERAADLIRGRIAPAIAAQRAGASTEAQSDSGQHELKQS